MSSRTTIVIEDFAQMPLAHKKAITSYLKGEADMFRNFRAGKVIVRCTLTAKELQLIASGLNLVIPDRCAFLSKIESSVATVTFIGIGAISF